MKDNKLTNEKIVGYYGTNNNPIIEDVDGTEIVCSLCYYNPADNKPVNVVCQSTNCKNCNSGYDKNYISGCRMDPKLDELPTAYFY